MALIGGKYDQISKIGKGMAKGVKSGGRMAGNLWDDVTGVTAAEGAAEAQRKALSEATASQERMFEKSLATQAPWLEAGERALGGLEAGIESGAFDVDPGQFQADGFHFDFEADPGYQFRLSEGTKALEASAAARGGLFSEGTGKNLMGFGQGLASQEYGNAYRRARGEFESDRAFGYGQFADDYGRRRQAAIDPYNRLASLAGVGQLTSSNVAGQQMQQGGNLANLQLQGGNIGAQRSMAGYQGGMNLLNTALQGGALAAGAM